MSAEEFERVDVEDLFVGWVVVLGNLPHEPGRRRFEVTRREGELTLVDLSGGLPVPLSVVDEMPIYRVHMALPSWLGYYKTEDPDHEIVERTSSAWRSTDVDGSPLSPAEVREMGDLELLVPHAQVMHVLRTSHASADTTAQSLRAELAEARRAVPAAHAAGRRAALTDVWVFLRERGPAWLLVRRAVARRFGRALLGGGS